MKAVGSVHHMAPGGRGAVRTASFMSPGMTRRVSFGPRGPPRGMAAVASFRAHPLISPAMARGPLTFRPGSMGPMGVAMSPKRARRSAPIAQIPELGATEVDSGESDIESPMANQKPLKTGEEEAPHSAPVTTVPMDSHGARDTPTGEARKQAAASQARRAQLSDSSDDESSKRPTRPSAASGLSVNTSKEEAAVPASAADAAKKSRPVSRKLDLPAGAGGPRGPSAAHKEPSPSRLHAGRLGSGSSAHSNRSDSSQDRPGRIGRPRNKLSTPATSAPLQLDSAGAAGAARPGTAAAGSRPTSRAGARNASLGASPARTPQKSPVKTVAGATPTRSPIQAAGDVSVPASGSAAPKDTTKRLQSGARRVGANRATASRQVRGSRAPQRVVKAEEISEDRRRIMAMISDSSSSDDDDGPRKSRPPMFRGPRPGQYMGPRPVYRGPRPMRSPAMSPAMTPGIMHPMMNFGRGAPPRGPPPNARRPGR